MDNNCIHDHNAAKRTSGNCFKKIQTPKANKGVWEVKLLVLVDLWGGGIGGLFAIKLEFLFTQREEQDPLDAFFDISLEEELLWLLLAPGWFDDPCLSKNPP